MGYFSILCAYILLDKVYMKKNEYEKIWKWKKEFIVFNEY